jgi:hypothetical protein
MSNKSVYIEGDKSGFNSQSALLKFKNYVKSSANLDNLKQFIKADYEVVQLEDTDTFIKYNIKKKVVEQNNNIDKKQMFKAKMKLLSDKRTNINIKNLSLNKDVVPQDIREAYSKLSKISAIPIPEPVEILRKPEEYKPLILQVLRSNVNNTNKLYMNYFRLLAQHVGLTPSVPEMEISKKQMSLATIDDNETKTESEDD